MVLGRKHAADCQKGLVYVKKNQLLQRKIIFALASFYLCNRIFELFVTAFYERVRLTGTPGVENSCVRRLGQKGESGAMKRKYKIINGDYMKKYLLLAVLGIASIAGNAQVAQTASRDAASVAAEKSKLEKKDYVGIDVGLGKMTDGDGGVGAFGLGLHWERHYNPYVAWDVVSFAWDAPFHSPKSISRLSLKTGIRGFSPNLFSNVRAYANLDFGYSVEEEWLHGIGLEVGFGLRIGKHVGVGYALNWDSQTRLKGNHFRLSVLF